MIQRAVCAVLVLALFVTPIQATTTTCFYMILDTVTITYTDGAGNVLGTDTRYFFGYSCVVSDGGSYERVTYSGQSPTPPQPPPVPPPDTGGCSLSICSEMCDLEYAIAIQDDIAPTPYGNGTTIYHCGPFCRDLAAADRNACYGVCLEDCNKP